MKTKQITEITMFQTPDKGPRPDLKHQSHLKTTIPSVFDVSSPEDKRTSQFGAHYSKMRNYDDFGATGEIQSEKRGVSKNQWQLRQKVDEYESQISSLRQYLQSSQCRCLQRGSISRIFNFPQQQDSLLRQQQRVIKQLGNKVKGLVKENASLKSQNTHYSQLKVDQLIKQNQKLQSLLQQYKGAGGGEQKRLNEQNELLRDELYRQKLQYEEGLKSLQQDYEDKLKNFRAKQLQLGNKIRQLSITIQQQERQLKMNKTEQQLLTINKLENIQSSHTKQLLQQEIFYKRQLDEQERYYRQQKSLMEEEVEKFVIQRERNIQLVQQLATIKQSQAQEMQTMKQFYTDAIHDIDRTHSERLNQLNRLLQMLQQRLIETDESIKHLKFERDNRIQSTIKKSHNVALSPTKPRGQVNNEQPIIEQGWEENVRINTKPLSYALNPMENKLAAHQIDILKEKITYLEKEIQRLEVKIQMVDKMNIEKTQKIIVLENQISNLNLVIKSLNQNLTQSQNQVQIKEVIKQVPITTTAVPKQYSQQVKHIKQTIISCNLANFDTFQNQFTQIIQQRNQLNERMMSLKKQAKESSKVLVLEKHLKVERERNRLLEESLKRYEREIENLKIQVIQLQGEIENIQQASRIQETKESMSQKQQNRDSLQHLPDGKAGLQWQKVVKHCLMTSINRLQNLQNRMRQDIGQSTA